MEDRIFENLIKNHRRSDNGKDNISKILDDIIFANITFTLNKEQMTGTYEFFGDYQIKDLDHQAIRDEIKNVVDDSFEAIRNGNCYSFYKYLSQSHRRYGRILVEKGKDFNECRLSGDSAFDDVNKNKDEHEKGHVDYIESDDDIKQLKDAEKLWSQEVIVNGEEKEVDIDTILKFYSRYYNAIWINNNNPKPVYFYLVRPALDNERLNGMLYFASFKEVSLDNLREISYRLSNELSSRIFNRLDRESIKSAVAAIMSRNLSHNLGSHYLYYTKTALEEIAEESGNLGPDIRGAAKVLSYIQSRMDYLATIISNDKYPYGSVNFKSQIWDDLTIDDFSKRHYSEKDSLKISNLDFGDQKAAVKSLIKQSNRLLAVCDELQNKSPSEKAIIIDADYRNKMEMISRNIGAKYSVISKGGINCRTTNFLLTNLVLSENYTRPNINSESVEKDKKPLQLYVSLWDEIKHKYELFTGTDNANSSNGVTKIEEEVVKTKLSSIDLALPGGTMSCHAFFNILENFIRNSAKYSWGKRYEQKELVFTVAMKVDHKNHMIDFTIFDNKCDAYKKRENKTLIHSLKSRLSSLVILGENNTIDKDNKGLKEMLFSAVWLRANEFDKSLETIFSEIQTSSKESKLETIKNYAFEFVSVNQNGMPCSDSRWANLGIKFTLPIFKRSETLRKKKIHLSQLLRLHTDIVEIPIGRNLEKRLVLGRPYESIFPRLCYSDYEVVDVRQLLDMPVLDKSDKEVGEDVTRLRAVINKNIGNIDEYLLTMNGTNEPVINTTVPFEHHQTICYDDHFSTKKTKLELKDNYYGKYAYVDTISGSNFSKTLEGMFKAGIVEKNGCRFYASWSDMYLSLKIKEASLTRITIIDERLFNSIKWKLSGGEKIDIRRSAYELSMRNVRVLNFDDLGISKPNKKKKTFYFPQNPLAQVCGFPLLYGNTFLHTGPFASHPNGCHFLTIHLGLLEKILKSDRANDICGEKGDNALSEKRVLAFMKAIRNIFSLPNSYLHICIHSGRGNFSSELAGPLKEYPFISLAALESSFNNSKYLLAQLFYNTVYIGKGEINK